MTFASEDTAIYHEFGKRGTKFPGNRCGRNRPGFWRPSGDLHGAAGPGGAARLDRLDQVARLDRLLHAAGRAEFERHAEEIQLRGAATERIARHGDDRHARGAFAEYLDDIEPIHSRHDEVDE